MWYISIKLISGVFSCSKSENQNVNIKLSSSFIQTLEFSSPKNIITLTPRSITISQHQVRPKKKMFVCPFPTDPKFWKTCVAFFFYIQFCIFKQNCWNKSFKIHCTVPKVYYVRHRRYLFYVYPIHVSTRLFDVTYLGPKYRKLYAFL